MLKKIIKKKNYALPNYLTAAVLEKINKPLLIKSFKIPQIKKGQLLVKVLYSGICRSQLMEIEGKRGKDKWLPHLLGHEASGIVIGLGKSVKRFKKGDEIILTWIKGSGLDVKGGEYKYKNKVYNSGPITTFSNYTIVSENRAQKKPSNISLLKSTLLGCALPTGFGVVKNAVKLNKVSSIAILGIGGIGLSAVLSAKLLSIKNILALDIENNKLETAKKLGAHHTLNTKNLNFKRDYKKLFPDGVDLCIEAAGLSKTIELGFEIINPKFGKLIFTSHPSKKEKIRIDPFELICGKSIEGSWGGGINPDKDLELIAKKITKSQMLNLYTGNIYPLENINKAIKDFKTGKVLRPIIKMEHS